MKVILNAKTGVIYVYQANRERRRADERERERYRKRESEREGKRGREKGGKGTTEGRYDGGE